MYPPSAITVRKDIFHILGERTPIVRQFKCRVRHIGRKRRKRLHLIFSHWHLSIVAIHCNTLPYVAIQCHILPYIAIHCHALHSALLPLGFHCFLTFPAPSSELLSCESKKIVSPYTHHPLLPQQQQQQHPHLPQQRRHDLCHHYHNNN